MPRKLTVDYSLRPVHEVHVDVFDVQVLERLLECLLDAMMRSVPGGDA